MFTCWKKLHWTQKYEKYLVASFFIYKELEMDHSLNFYKKIKANIYISTYLKFCHHPPKSKSQKCPFVLLKVNNVKTLVSASVETEWEMTHSKIYIDLSTKYIPTDKMYFSFLYKCIIQSKEISQHVNSESLQSAWILFKYQFVDNKDTYFCISFWWILQSVYYTFKQRINEPSQNLCGERRETILTKSSFSSEFTY